jgi:hypothetical protein
MMTKLDAVNEALAAIGESRVSALDIGQPDALAAEAKLERVTAKVLELGWHVNTDRAKLVPDVNGHILVEDNVLRIDTVGNDAPLDVVVRREEATALRKLWDRKTSTFVIGRAVQVEITRNLPFDDLTEALKSYIAARTAREFQEDEMGSARIDQMIARKEIQALDALHDAESENEDLNMLTANPALARARYRRSELWGL